MSDLPTSLRYRLEVDLGDAERPIVLTFPARDVRRTEAVGNAPDRYVLSMSSDYAERLGQTLLAAVRDYRAGVLEN